METFFAALVDYLATQGIGSVGTTLFEHQLPADVNGVAVRETPGNPRRNRGEQWLRCQVLSRHTTHATARAKAWDAYDLLRDQQPLRLSASVGCTHARAIQPPTALGMDEGGAWRFVFNVDFLFSAPMP